MRPTFVALTSVALTVFVAGAAAAQSRPQMPRLSAQQLVRLEAGEVLVQLFEDSATAASALGIIEAEPEDVRRLLEDFESTRLFVPMMTESRVAGHEGSFDLHRGRLETPWPMDAREFTFRTWQRELTLEGQEVWQSAFDYVQGSGNLVDAFGHWLVIPWEDGRTLVQFEVTVELGTWMPSAVSRWATERMLPSLVEGLRLRALRQS